MKTASNVKTGDSRRCVKRRNDDVIKKMAESQSRERAASAWRSWAYSAALLVMSDPSGITWRTRNTQSKSAITRASIVDVILSLCAARVAVTSRAYRCITTKNEAAGSAGAASVAVGGGRAGITPAS